MPIVVLSMHTYRKVPDRLPSLMADHLFSLHPLRPQYKASLIDVANLAPEMNKHVWLSLNVLSSHFFSPPLLPTIERRSTVHAFIVLKVELLIASTSLFKSQY